MAALSAEIPVHAAADDSSPTVGILPAGEQVKPIAESQGAGGVTWYLVKSQSGVLGWIKRDDSAQARNVDHFFRNLPTAPSTIAVDIPARSASTAPRGAVIVPVHFIGRSILVPVTFNRSTTAHLVLDTGAGMTMITHKLATTLRLPSIGSSYLTGIGGTVRTEIARVDSVRVGDAEVAGMPISIHDAFNHPKFEGLLGMDFLGRFHVSVDSAKHLLILAPR